MTAVGVALFAGAAAIGAALVWLLDRWLAGQCRQAVELAWQQHCENALGVAADDLAVCERIWEVSQ